MPSIDLGEARRITGEKEKNYGLPEGTLYKIGGIESAFNAKALSHKGAQGYFQFMPDTAKAYGLKDPGNFEQAADAAGRYMRDGLKRYGGNLDLALADYNGGHKAAKALASGKPWAETANYLAKFHGGKAPVPLSPQVTTARNAAPLSASPSASELYRDAQQHEAANGGMWNNIANLPAAIGDGFAVDNSVYNFFKDKGISSTDPDFKWNDENSEQFLEGVPERHWGYILQATSAQEATYRRSRMMDTMEKERELGQMGVAGFAGRLTGALVDIPTLVAFVPGMGGGGLLSTTSRVANAARLGIFNAAFNVAADAATGQYRPTFTTDSLYLSALMGLGLGGTIGAALNPGKIGASRLAAEQAQLAKFGQREAAAAQRAELVDVAGGSHAIDQARLDAHLPHGGANMDTRTATAALQGDQEVDAIVRQIRQEVIQPAANRVRDDLGLNPKGSDLTAPVNSRGAPEVRGTPDGIPAVRSPDVPVFDRTSLANRSPKGAGESTARELLVSLRESSDSLVAGLAARLETQLADDVRVVTRRAGSRSYYDPAAHEIHIRSDAPDNVKLHEIAHAMTANKIRFGFENPGTAHGQLAQELHHVFRQVRVAAQGEKLGKDAKYFLKNIDEFVAGLYSGKSEFLDFLARTRLPELAEGAGHSFLSKAVDIVRKILGMDPAEANALTEALGIADRLIDTPLRVRQELVQRAGPAKRVDYLMEPANPVDQATIDAANAAEIPTVFGWGLGLENRLGGKNAPSSVRDLASKLFGTTIGYKDHTVVKANAWDDTTKWADSWAVEMRKGTYPEFEKWFKQQDLKAHEKGKAFEDFGAQVSNYIRGFEGDFAPEVVKAGTHMRNTLAKVVDYINNPLFDEGLKKRGLTEVEIRDIHTNTTELVGRLEKNPNYLPRKHDINKWNDMATSFGREAVEGWWARAYKAGRENVTDEAAARWSKWYVRTVEEAHANRSQDLLEDIMRGTDKDALKASLKLNGGFDDFEAQTIIDDMFPTKPGDAGRMASLKHRSTINETFSETWTRSDGTSMQVTLNDFIHSNAFDVVEPYLRRTAGSVALAKHLDIYKTNQIDDAISDATTNKLGSEFKKPAELAKYRKDLKFAFERLQGLPTEEFTGLNKSMEMWRNFNVIRLMGGAVWNQASEMSQIVGSMGWKATSGAIPELRALRRDIASGKAPNDILDHLENTIGGVGSEYVARLEFKAADDWVRNKGDTAFNRKLDALDTTGRKLAKGVLDYTGMTPLMVQQKRVHAVALVNHWVNTAKGVPSKFLSKERLAWMGLDEDAYQRVLNDIDRFTTAADGQFSRSHKMDFAEWAKEAPETYSKFMTAIHRESRRVVQENDLGSMIPLMGTTLGKTVFQFMNFSMHGWNKSMQFALNHRDWTTLSTVLHGSLFASLTYMGRTMLSAQGMAEGKRGEFLEKRMAPGQIVANSFGRLAQASLLPVAFDTISPYPLFNGMRTTSDLSSLASNPTYQAVNGLISMKKLVRNGVSDEYQTTEKDVRTWGKLAPLNNVYPISSILNSLASDYPHSEEQ